LQNLVVNGELFKINGNVPTLLGESYANFGFLGPLLMITPISFIMCILYVRVKKSIDEKKITYSLIFYLAIFLSLFQIFRDGFSSILNFVLFAFFPLLFFKLINIKIFSKN
jgi:oligosaccharide repeat unit polymerase